MRKFFLILYSLGCLLFIVGGCGRKDSYDELHMKKAEQDHAEVNLESTEAMTSAKQSDIDTFPWPPPEPSSQLVIPREFLVSSEGDTLFRDIFAKLKSALWNSGYTEVKWYTGNFGFIAVSRLEQIHPDGRPFKKNRWNVNYASSGEISMLQWISALFKARHGHFRVFTFVVTNKKFNYGERVDRKTAIDWLNHGEFNLPGSTGDIIFTPDHYCLALVYEFKKPKGEKPFFKKPSKLLAKTHLEKSKLWKELKEVSL